MSNFSAYESHLKTESLSEGTAGRAPGLQPRTLWIACADQIMDRVLQRFLDDASVLIWRHMGNKLPMPAWQSDESHGSLNDAVERWGIRQIVFCGHSMCSGFSAAQDGPADVKIPHFMDVLQQRVRQRQAMNDRAREHVIQQLGVLEEQPAIAHAISLGKLQLHGLFYLAESGLFTRYDKVSGQFVPIHD